MTARLKWISPEFSGLGKWFEGLGFLPDKRRKDILNYAKERIGFEKAESPQFFHKKFDLETLLPRDFKKFQRLKSADVALGVIRQTVLEFRFWMERAVPLIFVFALQYNRLKTEDVKSGDYKVLFRLSQNNENFLNQGILTTPQAQRMLKKFKDWGLIKNSTKWSDFKFEENNPAACYAKGYELNLWAIFDFLNAVDELILKPFHERFLFHADEKTFGDEDVSLYDFNKQFEVMSKYWTEYTDSGKMRADWKHVKKETGMSAAQILALESLSLSTNAELMLEKFKEKGMLEKLSKEIYGILKISAKMKPMLDFFNSDKGKSIDKISPHKMIFRRRFKGSKNGILPAHVTMRISNDACSIPKRDGVYKDLAYTERLEVFCKKLEAENLFEYDSKTSIHSDNKYLLTKQTLQGDFYTELLPVKIKESLMSDMDWCADVRKHILIPSGATLNEFLDSILGDRKAVKRLANVCFAVGGRGGMLYNHLFQRMSKENVRNEKIKNILKRYAEHFARVYTSIVGPSLGSFIYIAESYRMLFIAKKIMEDGYKAALIYDCLITDKWMSNTHWQYLNAAALDEFLEVGEDYFDYWKNARLCSL